MSDAVRVNDSVTARCQVKFVRPMPSIYWRRLPDGELHEGKYVQRRCSPRHGCVSITSEYTTHFDDSEDDATLQCVVTQPGDSSRVWATHDTKTSAVFCEWSLDGALVAATDT